MITAEIAVLRPPTSRYLMNWRRGSPRGAVVRRPVIEWPPSCGARVDGGLGAEWDMGQIFCERAKCGQHVRKKDPEAHDDIGKASIEARLLHIARADQFGVHIE